MSGWQDCDHEWREVDDQCATESRVSVVCTICGCPGEMTLETGDVDWPAT
jgi:hypothetical protein